MRAVAIQLDCFVASLLAMTDNSQGCWHKAAPASVQAEASLEKTDP